MSWLADAARRIAAAGIEQPRREARLLLGHAMGLTTDEILRLPPGHPVQPGDADRLIGRRTAHEPLAFITGRCGFWTLDLAVSPATLIPRADTETLIEAALALRPDRTRVRTVLDVGCGTGALLLAALAEYPAAFGVGVDRVEAACRLAGANAQAQGLAARAAILCADWMDALAVVRPGFDLILSNPPYIESGSIDDLMPEVAAHEPRIALDGGPDGLEAYRRLMPQLDRLSHDGVGVFEIGTGQEDAVAALAEAAGLAIVGRRHDLCGTVRAIAVEQSVRP